MSLIAELKRRKVFRVATAYAATAFAALRGADAAVPSRRRGGFPMRLRIRAASAMIDARTL